MINLYQHALGAVRVNESEMALIRIVEERPQGVVLPRQIAQKYRLLVEAIERVALWNLGIR